MSSVGYDCVSVPGKKEGGLWGYWQWVGENEITRLLEQAPTNHKAISQAVYNKDPALPNFSASLLLPLLIPIHPSFNSMKGSKTQKRERGETQAQPLHLC